MPVAGAIQQPNALVLSGELLPEQLDTLPSSIAAASFCHDWTSTGKEKEAGNGQRGEKEEGQVSILRVGLCICGSILGKLFYSDQAAEKS